MNRLRALAARLRRPQPLTFDSQLAAFEAIMRRPARRRNTRKELRP
ncbi:hypothetical protein [Streptomyces bugieae]|uniref:Uncharacterized protein n=1 Tax=Streptomyces bugieae TaxID=3098223 RepID=A0ABU7NMM3_9ACTN|nr:hypothetical protein [Streptomyces sp. DSM 41528]